MTSTERRVEFHCEQEGYAISGIRTFLSDLDANGFDFTTGVHFLSSPSLKLHLWQVCDLPLEGWLLRREMLKNPKDLFTLGVYADWLEDHDHIEAGIVRAVYQLNREQEKLVGWKTSRGIFQTVSGELAPYPARPTFYTVDESGTPLCCRSPLSFHNQAKYIDDGVD